jgi:hypothetical protein
MIVVIGMMPTTLGEMMQPVNTEYFSCSCHSAEHTLRFDYDPDDGELYTTVYLHAYRPWYQRVWLAVKYVFGRNRRYGDFDCFTLDPRDRDRFVNMATSFQRYHDSRQNAV